MSKSFTYHLTLFVLKLKGIKKIFSQDPVDYKKIRQEDVHSPKKQHFKSLNTSSFYVLKTKVTEVKQTDTSKKLLIFVHGGAFISGPAQHHWDSLKEILKRRNVVIWLCDYPKAPEHKIAEISANIDGVYDKALETYSPADITLLGDSVGGTLVATLTQRLVLKKAPVPGKLILISPVMDASLTNPDIAEVDLKDPMLSKKGILSAKVMCVGNESLTSPIISPLYGSFKDFPSTILFLGTHDIMYPDEVLAIQKLKDENVEHQVVCGEGMPHIWPLLPVMKEAKEALNQIIDQL